MDEPVVYVSTLRIKEGKFEDYRRFYAKMVEAIRERDRGVVAFYAFGNDDGTEITNVHVYPDRPTLDLHMQLLAEQMGLLPGDLTSVYAFMEPIGVQVYGSPSGQAAAMDQGLRDDGVPFTGKARYLGGFSLADRGAGTTSS
jgi:quinol monooxygenase YgiN